MCFPKPEVPKPDPSVLAAQAEQRRIEQERVRELKEDQLRKRKTEMGGYGMRSLISGGGSGYGRNFFG